MRPVRGIITGLKDSTLVVLLESGKKIRTQQKPGLVTGKPVLVYYDFTTSEVKDIQLEVKHNSAVEVVEMEVMEPPEETITGIDDGIEEIPNSGFWFPGALLPSCEGSWDTEDIEEFEIEIVDFEEF
jgi:hypothetical protein